MEVQLENGKIIHIVKLPLGKYADLLQAFQELPKHLEEFKAFKSFSNSQFFATIPSLIGNCMPDIIRVINVATELTEDEIQALGLVEVTDILMAIYKVNNYQAVFDRIKKVIAQPTQPAQTNEISTPSN